MNATATQFGLLNNRGSASPTLNPFGYGSGIGREQDANMGSADSRRRRGQNDAVCQRYTMDAGVQSAFKHLFDRFKARWSNKHIL